MTSEENISFCEDINILVAGGSDYHLYLYQLNGINSIEKPY